MHIRLFYMHCVLCCVCNVLHVCPNNRGGSFFCCSGRWSLLYFTRAREIVYFFTARSANEHHQAGCSSSYAFKYTCISSFHSLFHYQFFHERILHRTAQHSWIEYMYLHTSLLCLKHFLIKIKSKMKNFLVRTCIDVGYLFTFNEKFTTKIKQHRFLHDTWL